jgi:L-rhamnose mutarotase
MRRVATFMLLRRGLEERYRDEHANIWPEVVDGIRRFGIRNYSIFMRGCELYSYFEVEDLDEAMAAAAGDPDNQRWQAHMADFFDTGPGVADGNTAYLERVLEATREDVHNTAVQRVASLTWLERELASPSEKVRAQLRDQVLHGTTPYEILKYSLFLHRDKLFSYCEVVDWEPDITHETASESFRAWQASALEPFGGVPGTTTFLEEVFHVA